MSRPCRAIIIDDETWIREGLSEHINWERIGIDLARSFEDGSEALKELMHNPIDIIMTDIRMPNMTGLEFLSELRKIERDRPNFAASKVIIMSGFDDFKYAQEAIRLEAFEYLLKPTEIEEIEEVLLRVKSRCIEDNLRVQDHPKLPQSPEGMDKTVSYLVKRTLRLLNERFTDDLNLAQIAEELFITPNYLSRKFRMETASHSVITSRSSCERA